MIILVFIIFLLSQITNRDFIIYLKSAYSIFVIFLFSFFLINEGKQRRSPTKQFKQLK